MSAPKGDIPAGTYEVKLGASWDTSSRDKSTYHTLKYDFKPKSVANETETYIAMGQNGDVQVAVPAENDALTMYKGGQKPLKEARECLLFYNPKTGEVRLEKVTSNITVKKTRDTEPATEAYLRTEIARLRTTSTSRRGGQSSSDDREMSRGRTATPPSSELLEPERRRKISSSSSSSSSSGSSSSDDSDDDENNFKNAPPLGGVTTAKEASPIQSSHSFSTHQAPMPSSSINTGYSIPPPQMDAVGLSNRQRGFSESSNMEMSSDDDDDANMLQAMMSQPTASAPPPPPPQAPPSSSFYPYHQPPPPSTIIEQPVLFDSMPTFSTSMTSSSPTATTAKSAIFNDLALSESSDEED